MAERKYPPKEIPQLRADISELQLKGWKQNAIAARFGITQQAVSEHLKCIRALQEKRTVTDREEARQEALDRLDYQMQMQWFAIDKLQKHRPTSLVDQLKIEAAIDRKNLLISKWSEEKNKLLGLYDTAGLYTAVDGTEDNDTVTEQDARNLLYLVQNTAPVGEHESISKGEPSDGARTQNGKAKAKSQSRKKKQSPLKADAALEEEALEVAA